jgi:uncharacterized membrane protein YgdD (TMEM256/DUF423 family)
VSDGAKPTGVRAGVALAGALGFSAVALGAFGAHGLRERLGSGMLDVYRTGALYHLVHAAVALAVALGADRLRRPRLILGLLTGGVVVFSGSLYALAITGLVNLGAVTPLGGLMLLAAWATIAAEPFGRGRAAP